VTKIPDDKLSQVDRRNKRKDSKKQRTTSDNSIEMSKYVVVITALPDIITAINIIALYRFRWQVEIYFKRLKSIMNFGNVPLRREDSIFARLNGKLLAALLIEQMISEVDFSPYRSEDTQHLERSKDYFPNDT
jgi:transposase